MSVEAEGPDATPSLSQQGVMWVLLAIGLILVLFADSLGHALVSKNQFGPNSFSWNPDEARAIAANVRVIGCMAFAAGLVERLIIAITNSKFGAVS